MILFFTFIILFFILYIYKFHFLLNYISFILFTLKTRVVLTHAIIFLMMLTLLELKCEVLQLTQNLSLLHAQSLQTEY